MRRIMKSKERILSLVLSFVMVVSLAIGVAPITVYATNYSEETWNVVLNESEESTISSITSLQFNITAPVAGETPATTATATINNVADSTTFISIEWSEVGSDTAVTSFEAGKTYQVIAMFSYDNTTYGKPTDEAGQTTVLNNLSLNGTAFAFSTTAPRRMVDLGGEDSFGVLYTFEALEGHDYAEEWSTTDSHHWHECECGAKADEAEHSFGAWTETKAPGCTTAGEKERNCSVCGYVDTEAVEATGHDYAEEWSTTDSHHWHECECGAEADKVEHTASDWIIDTPATTESEGSKHKECTVCARVLERATIDKLEADHTCSFGGAWQSDATNHWHACECGAKSDTAAHDIIWYVTKDATETTEGEMKGKCSICGHTDGLVQTIPTTSGDITVEDGTDNDLEGSLKDEEDVKGKVPLTEEERAAINNGEDLKITLVVVDVDKNVNGDSERQAIVDALSGKTIGTFLDIELLKKVGSNSAVNVTETEGLIGITVVVPGNLRNAGVGVTRTFSIIRNHDGVVETVTSTYDEDTYTLTFYTDKFSAYALAYTDTNHTHVDGNNDNKCDVCGADMSTGGGNDDGGNNTNNNKDDANVPTEDKKDEVPKTGDSNTATYALIMMLVSGLGIILLGKKKTLLVKED